LRVPTSCFAIRPAVSALFWVKVYAGFRPETGIADEAARRLEFLAGYR
jgi:hypothetical protein